MPIKRQQACGRRFFRDDSRSDALLKKCKHNGAYEFWGDLEETVGWQIIDRLWKFESVLF
jgi:hypothetical protein